MRFVLFGGEEQGCSAVHYVATLPAERARVRAVVNMDMIATLNTPDAERPARGSRGFPGRDRRTADAAATYTGLTVQTVLSPFNSDHVPFIDAGLPAVLTIEAPTAPTRVHTRGDTLTPSTRTSRSRSCG